MTNLAVFAVFAVPLVGFAGGIGAVFAVVPVLGVLLLGARQAALLLVGMTFATLTWLALVVGGTLERPPIEQADAALPEQRPANRVHGRLLRQHRRARQLLLDSAVDRDLVGVRARARA
ncbi:MAG: hypothetical protein QM813_08885 [Verrucomicrobiota bacterium]